MNRQPPARDELRRHDRHRISRIVWAEVLAGEPPARRPAIRQIIAAFEIVEVDESIAAAAADIRQRSRMKLLDALILATAQVNRTELVTRNTKDFPAEMPGIRVPYVL